MEIQINIWIVIAILAIHWFADFVMQTDKQATGKSKNWNDLLSHTCTYSTIFLLPICILFGINNPNETSAFYIIHSFAFCGISFVAHTTQDYITSRINSRLWNEKKVHLFFVSIGFDQLLHFIQLLLTYQLLK